MFCLFWPRIFIFCFVSDTEKLDYMLKTKIVRRIRIRGQISNFGHLGRIPVEILESKSRIWKSSSKSKKCQTPEFNFMFFWKPLSLRTRRNKNRPVFTKKTRVPLASTRVPRAPAARRAARCRAARWAKTLKKCDIWKKIKTPEMCS